MIDALVGNNYSIYLCNALKDLGLNIRLVVTENRVVEFPINFPLIKLSPSKDKSQSKLLKMIKYLNYLYKLIIVINKNHIDVVHFQFFRRHRLESMFFFLLGITRIKLAFTVHDVLPLNRSNLDKFFNILVYKASDVLFVHSVKNKQDLLKQAKIEQNKIKIVPHGNFDHYAVDQNLSKEQARKGFCLNNDDKVLLFFGFVKEYKGLDDLLKAVDLASESLNDLTLLIAGSCETKQEENMYKRMISSISKRVKIISSFEFIPLEKVAIFFLACDVVMLPYKRISHSGILHLSYSFGRPVIGTKIGDFEEFIDNGKSGLITNSNDPIGIAQAIIDFYSDKWDISEMGEYSKRLSDTKFSWSKIADQTIIIYKQVALK
jgi:glycosyltransferase involved in cell wall biosynthesis